MAGGARRERAAGRRGHPVGGDSAAVADYRRPGRAPGITGPGSADGRTASRGGATAGIDGWGLTPALRDRRGLRGGARRVSRPDGSGLGRPLGGRRGIGADSRHPAAHGTGPQLRRGRWWGRGEGAAQADREHQRGDRQSGQLTQRPQHSPTGRADQHCGRHPTNLTPALPWRSTATAREAVTATTLRTVDGGCPTWCRVGQTSGSTSVVGVSANSASRSPTWRSASAGCRNRPAGLRVYSLRRPTRVRCR